MPQGRAGGGGGGGRKRELLTAIVARMEEELRQRQRQLYEEIARNTVARAHIPLLGALSEARIAIQHYYRSRRNPAAGVGQEAREALSSAAASSLQRLDELVAATKQVLTGQPPDGTAAATAIAAAAAAARVIGRTPTVSGSNASDDGSCGGAGATSSDAALPGAEAACTGAALGRRPQSGTAAPPLPPELIGGGMAWKASDMIQAIIGACDTDMDRDAFVAFWKEKTSELSLLLRQFQSRTKTAEDLERAVREMAVAYGALFLDKPWFLQLMGVNINTGQEEAPSPDWWAAVSRAMAPSAQQLPLFDHLFSWLQSAHASLRRDCVELARMAMAGPADPELQDAAVAGLDRVQLEYRLLVVSHKVVAMAALMSPFQVAQLFVMSWPFIPIFGAVLEATPRAPAGGA